MGVGRLRKGDGVHWRSFGEKRGRVVRKVVSPSTVKGLTVATSPARPHYLVRLEASGRMAAPERRALKRFR
jgi:hypothetical protein